MPSKAGLTQNKFCGNLQQAMFMRVPQGRGLDILFEKSEPKIWKTEFNSYFCFLYVLEN